MSPHASPQTLIAFDVGTKRTGVAVGQTVSRTAQVAGLLEVKNGKFNWQHVDELINQWQPNACVIGDPNSDCPHLNKVIARLKHHLRSHKLTLIDVDETLSSVQANSLLNAGQQAKSPNTRKKTELRDQVAACVILQRYFDQL